jgi:hypothetical protein
MKSIGIVIAAVIAAVLIGFYATERTNIVTVRDVTTQQHQQGNAEYFSTSYNYIVSTDIGLYEIKPSGSFASPSFGTIKTGKKYRITSRGFTVAFFGVYPYIIEAEPVNT